MASFKRKLFYFGGFDPRGARHYHAIAVQEVARGTGMTIGAMTIGPRRAHGADVAWTFTTPDCACEEVFLQWDDIVRAHWLRGPLMVWARAMVAYWGFIARLDWRVGRHFARGSLLAFYGPGVAMIALAPLVGVLAAAGVAHWAGAGVLAGAAGLVAAGGLVLGLLALWRLHGFWLLRFAIFNDAYVRGLIGPELEQRLDRFAASIVEALGQGEGEVLLVTHSNGAVLAMPVIDRLLAHYGGVLPDRFALVTLGGCIPLMAARRDAGPLRAVFDRVAQAQLTWLDLASPTDGACVPRLAPFAGRGRAAPDGFVQMNPLWYRYCTLRRSRDTYRAHFDYLRRMDRASPLDFLSLATAARPLVASIQAFRDEHG